MKVYHASNMRVECPDTSHSRREFDFGRGFYVTTIRQQAEKYAWRFMRRGEQAWLNVYELDDDLAGWAVRCFDSYDEEWLDFVIRCRKGVAEDGDYDMVVGGIADDKVFETVDCSLPDCCQGKKPSGVSLLKSQIFSIVSAAMPC